MSDRGAQIQEHFDKLLEEMLSVFVKDRRSSHVFLKERHTKGEISKDEFDKIKEDSKD